MFKKAFLKWSGIFTLVFIVGYLIEDIVITNILGGYYCSQEPNPKTFIKEKIEYPESIYWEDNVYPGFNEAGRKLMIHNYLDGKHLKKIALNGDDGNIYVYEATPDDFKSLEYGKRYTLDRYNQHAKLIMKREKVYSKDTMPQMNYTVTFNQVALNWFVKQYLYSDETQVMDNQTQEVIAYNKRYMRFFYKLVPDFAGGKYYVQKPMCGSYRHRFNSKLFAYTPKYGKSGGVDFGAAEYRIHFNKWLYQKHIKEGK